MKCTIMMSLHYLIVYCAVLLRELLLCFTKLWFCLNMKIIISTYSTPCDPIKAINPLIFFAVLIDNTDLSQHLREYFYPKVAQKLIKFTSSGILFRCKYSLRSTSFSLSRDNDTLKQRSLTFQKALIVVFSLAENMPSLQARECSNW